MEHDVSGEQLPELSDADYAYVAAVENGFVGFDGIVYQRACNVSSLTDRLFVPCVLSLQVLPEQADSSSPYDQCIVLTHA